jgi:3-dehydroquinate synthase
MKSKTEIVEVHLGERSYRIEIGASLWPQIPQYLGEHFKPGRLLVISDQTVSGLYADQLSEALAGTGWQISFHAMEAGEQHKTVATVARLWDEILSSGCDRKSVVVALGGGVPGDTAGFVAATLLRGLAFVQIPTTLLAMVDSSVGGKTGVDMPQGKNLVGAFHQPSHVMISLDTLDTLPQREFLAGMAEVIKYGVIHDPGLFEFIEINLSRILAHDHEACIRMICRCCEIKAEVVSQDEHESGLREILNFGHTVGHAIESALTYQGILHGEAVAIGMMVETRLAVVKGLCDDSLSERLGDLLLKTGLPIGLPDISPDNLWTRMLADKKSRAGHIRMVLPKSLGQVETFDDIMLTEFEQACLLSR